MVGNRFEENGVQVAVDGGGDVMSTRFLGNAWSDYTGYDLDRDRIGDLPYIPRSVSGELSDRRPAARFFAGTVAAGLLDLLGAAFPMFAPRPLLHDDRPGLT